MLASHERGSLSIKSSSSSSSSSSSKPINGVRPKKDVVSKITGDTKPIRIGAHDRSDSYSLSSVDVVDSNDLKYMDDSTSSSSASSISGGVDLCSSASTASTSPTTAQSSHSQDTLKFDTRSPLACPLTNGSSGPPNPNFTSSRPNFDSLANGKHSITASRHSAPVHRPTYMAKPSRIPVLTSLGRVKPSDTRNGSEPRSRPRPFGNESSESEKRSPSNSPTSPSRTPVRKDTAEYNGFSSWESSAESDDSNSQKRPHSQPDYNVTSSPLPNGDVPRVILDGRSPERSPNTMRNTSRDEHNNEIGKSKTSGYRGSTEFDEDHRLHELLAMVSDSESDTESIAESIYHQPPKAADRSAASRLAKRLFHLDGFRITDVAKHLCKRNDFSQLVGEEFAGLFDFANQRVDTALRTFLNTFSLTGESQERERILLHFSRRYYACNPDAYPSEEACHTLVCALMLLNTDLHSQGVTRKMSCQEFISNLCQVHCNGCFSRDELKTLYNAIKQEPLRWPQQFTSIPNTSVGADPAMMNFVNLYYPGPPGPYGPPGTTPTGILTPTGFYPNPHHPNMPMMLGAPSVSVAPFNTYPTLLQTSYPTMPYMSGQSMTGGFPVPGVVPVSQPLLGSGPLAYASPLYWNAPVSTSVIAASLNTSASPSTTGSQVGVVTDTILATKSSLVTGTNPFIDLMAETNAREYMRGLLVRKWVMESHGKKTSLGRRGWKVYYARLRDLVLYMYKNAIVANAAARAEELHNLHQQQMQQHQNYMRHLVMQQQQLAPLQSREQSEHEDNNEDGDAKVGEHSGNSLTEGYVSDLIDAKDSHVGDGSVADSTLEQTQSTTGNNSSSASMRILQKTRPDDKHTSGSDEFSADNSQREDEIDNESCSGPNSNPPQIGRNSSVSGLDQQAVSLDSPCATLDANSSVSPSLSKGTAKTATTISGISHPYMMENSPAIGSTMCVPPSMTFAPTPHAALAFPPPPSFVPPAIPPPEAVIRIAHAIASRATDYLKKPNVFRLKTREGAEYLFEVADAKELDMWVERINFVAALLSAPSIPGPIGSERGFYRPHLPVTCTKLSMREQLEEHQRRLIELGRELSDLHKRLPITSGSKTLRPTRASSISGRTSDVARAAAAAVLARNANRESKSAKKEENSVASDITTGTMEVDLISSTEQQRVDENNTEPVTTSNPNSTSVFTNATNTSSSSTVSLISVFSTSSLGRRRKTSSGSLCGTADTTLGPVLTAKQRAEHEERVQFTEAEIHRYKTYARLLEAELFRIQQSSAAVAHAAALAAANNFSPYINPYNLPGSYHGFQQYSPIGFGSGLSMPFSAPVPTQPPRHFLPRDHPAPAYTAAPNMLPLAVLGPTDPLEEESTSAEHTLDPVSSTSHANTSGCMNTAPLPSLYPVPATVPVATRPRSLSYSYYGHQLIPPSPYSPSVSGRFYSHPRQLRNPHFRQQPQQLGFGAPGSGSFGRTNGMMMLLNGHRLAEEDSTTESPPSDPVTVPTEGEPSSTSICSTSGNADKFKVPIQSSQPLCSTEGMFYEIV